MGQSSFALLSGGPMAEDAVGTITTGTSFTVGVRTWSPSVGHGLELRTFSGSGSPMSTQVVPLPGRILAQRMEPHPAGGSVICGARFVNDSTSLDPLLIRLDGAGNVQWTWSPGLPGGQLMRDAVVLTDGSVVLAGYTGSSEKHNAVVARISATGQQLWYAELPGPLDEEAEAVVADASSVMVTGRLMNYGGEADPFFARLDLNGTVLWTTSWGGVRDDAGLDLARNGAQCVMAGRTRSHAAYDHSTGTWNEAGYLIAIDQQGDTLWQRTFADTVHHRVLHAIAFTSNGDLLVAGTEQAVETGADAALLMRLTAGGSTLWERRFHLADEERPVQVRALPQGMLMCGSAFNASGRQVMLVRTDDNGN